jgi:hypothetical protein
MNWIKKHGVEAQWSIIQPQRTKSYHGSGEHVKKNKTDSERQIPHVFSHI